MDAWIWVVIVVALAIALAGGVRFLKRSTNRRIGGASTEAQRIVQNAERQAESHRDWSSPG
jgi:RNase Y-like protein